MVRLVIDTDPGVDDAHALLLAFAHPDARVEALTTVSGNVPLKRTTANACTILDILGRDTPVYAGWDRPLISLPAHATYFHGEDGLGDSGYPASPRQVEPEHAAQALIRMANEAHGTLTLVAIAPLTNIALATRLDPQLPHKYRRLVVMGGAIRGQGNTTPAAEFNFYADPEAAAIVLEAWPGLTLISWETALAHPFNAVQVETLLGIETPRGEFFRRISGRTLAFIQQIMGQKMLIEPDLLAVAAAIEPDVVRKEEARYGQVELAGQHTRGGLAVDWFGVTRQEPNARLALEMDSGRLWELLQMAVQGS
jgi:inosine-uridine nucleoside N-ribohydrolase